MVYINSQINAMQFNDVLNDSFKILDLIVCNKFRISSIRHCSDPLVTKDHHRHHPCLEYLIDTAPGKNLKINPQSTRKIASVIINI